MTNASKIAKQLHDELLNHPLVIEYQKYKKIIDSNPQYKEKDIELRRMQKEIINNYSLELVEEYKQRKEQFLLDPIISNYLSLKEELNSLLITLQEIINDNL